MVNNPFGPAQNCRVRSDTERETNDGDRGEDWRANQHANAEVKILAQALEPEPAPGLASLLVDHSDVAELPTRVEVRVAWGLARRNHCFRVELEMITQLASNLRVGRRSTPIEER